MKLRPSAFVPGSAANRKPRSTARESAVMPRISTSDASRLTTVVSPARRSFKRTRLLRRVYRDQQIVHGLGRIDGQRRHPPQRGHALDDAPHGGRCDPAAGRIAEGLGVRLRLVAHDEHHVARIVHREHADERSEADRKSTRLNSSHVKISYAVFCLKKKKAPR